MFPKCLPHVFHRLQLAVKDPAVRDIPVDELPPPPPEDPKKKKKKKKAEEEEEEKEPPPPPVIWTLADGSEYRLFIPDDPETAGDLLRCLVSRRSRLEKALEAARAAEAHAELIGVGEELFKTLEAEEAEQQVFEDERLRIAEEARVKAEKKAKKKAKKT
jgi:hypothetical protein